MITIVLLLLVTLQDFTEGEEVKLLECEHCFHSPCIVPWLELHGTCPVCRKELGKNGQAPGAEGGAASAGAPAGEPEIAAAGGEAGAPGSSSSNTQDSAHVSTSPGGTTTTTQSVTVSGTGGLTGLIQSALNQVFNANWSSQPNPGMPNSF